MDPLSGGSQRWLHHFGLKLRCFTRFDDVRLALARGTCVSTFAFPHGTGHCDRLAAHQGQGSSPLLFARCPVNPCGPSHKALMAHDGPEASGRIPAGRLLPNRV